MTVDTNPKSPFSSLWCKFNVFFLAMIWCFGLLLGVVVSFSVGDAFSSLMRLSFKSQVSFIHLLLTTFMPFLLTLAVLLLSRTWLFLLISFVKSFCYAYTMHAIILDCGAAGWLIQTILMLTECVSVLLLLWFWIRHISSERDLLAYDAVICFCVFLGIVFAEYYFISPFLATLI